MAKAKPEAAAEPETPWDAALRAASAALSRQDLRPKECAQRAGEILVRAVPESVVGPGGVGFPATALHWQTETGPRTALLFPLTRAGRGYFSLCFCTGAVLTFRVLAFKPQTVAPDGSVSGGNDYVFIDCYEPPV